MWEGAKLKKSKKKKKNQITSIKQTGVMKDIAIVLVISAIFMYGTWTVAVAQQINSLEANIAHELEITGDMSIERLDSSEQRYVYEVSYNEKRYIVTVYQDHRTVVDSHSFSSEGEKQTILTNYNVT